MNKKRTIVLASLLKPVDDPRMFEKLALSLAQTNKYAINIIGFSAKNIPDHPNITFFPLFNFKRLSLKRLLAPLKYWRFLLKVKPEVIIVTSPDLLEVSILHEILFGSQIIYDVQENYQQNIIWSSSLPSFIRYPLSYFARSREELAKRMIVHFFIAERCYMNECSFTENRFTLLENKARFQFKKASLPSPEASEEFSTTKRKKSEIRLLYSGTIAESYGIFDCLSLAEQWITKGLRVNLTIIGYCPREDTLKELLFRIENKHYIHLIGGAELVPHPLILQELQKADFALISYNLNPSNRGCMPTRIWECLAYKIPMIMKPEHPWISLMEEYGAGLVVDFQNPPEELPTPPLSFYQIKPIPSSFYWESEEEKLLKALECLF